MRPEEYRQIIKNLESHFEEFKVSCHGSQMFSDDDKRTIENQFSGAQSHYDQLVVQLPSYSTYYKIIHSTAPDSKKRKTPDPSLHERKNTFKHKGLII